MQVGPQDAAVDVLGQLAPVVEIPRSTKLSTHGSPRPQGVQARTVGISSSSTTIVIRMASTPSLNASSRPVLTGQPQAGRLAR